MSTNEYTPTTKQVRDTYGEAYLSRERAFDRWLAGVVADARREAWDEGRESLAKDLINPMRSDGTRESSVNPYRQPVPSRVVVKESGVS
jgi:hypothetical protein